MHIKDITSVSKFIFSKNDVQLSRAICWEDCLCSTVLAFLLCQLSWHESIMRKKRRCNLPPMQTYSTPFLWKMMINLDCEMSLNYGFPLQNDFKGEIFIYLSDFNLRDKSIHFNLEDYTLFSNFVYCIFSWFLS